MTYKKIHFIGIGGIGMSGAANLALGAGCAVSGSDFESSDMLHALELKGAHILTGAQDASRITNEIDLVVHSNAIQESNPELAQAQKLGISTKTYYQFVGELMGDKKQLVVTGMHGKSTTTAMLAQVLEYREKISLY